MKWSLTAVVVAVVAGLMTLLVLRRLAASPGTAAVCSFLEQEVAGGRLAFASMDRVDRPVGSDLVEIEFTAGAQAREALYQTIDTTEFAATTLGLDLAPVQEAKLLLQGKNAKRLRELAKLAVVPGDPLAIPVVRESAPRGATAMFRGRVLAQRAGKGWRFELQGGGWTTEVPQGRPRTNLPTGVVVAGAPADELRLRTAIEAYLDSAAKLKEARLKFEAELAAERQARIDTFLAQLAPGALYRGAATRRDDRRVTPLVLEIVSVKTETRRVEARLRNDGGWGDARRFQGAWSTDAEAENFKLTLATGGRDAIRDAGPFLSENDDWTLDFTYTADGVATAQTHSFDYSFRAVPAAEAAALKAELAGDFHRLLDATVAGTAYSGAAISKEKNSSEQVLLRFSKQENTGALLQAVLESPERASWRRPLTGTLIGNHYRSDGAPLRLEMADQTAVPAARDGSVFKATRWGGLQLKLALAEDGTVSGEDALFSYRLARATAAQLAAIEQEQAERVRRFTRVFSAGASYNGVARDEQGFSTRIRLRVRRVERESSTMQVVFESQQQGGIFHAMSGSYDADAGVVGFGSSGEGKFNPSGYLKVPFFSQDAVFKIALELGPEGLTGRLMNRHGGSTGWSLEFPLAMAGGAAESAVPFPREGGAYVLSGGQWVPLPRNNGKVVQSAGMIVGGLFGGLTNPGAQSQKLAEIVYDGPEQPPVVSGENLVVAFVGPLLPPDPKLLAQYPEIAGYPDLEIAPTRTGNDAKRRVDLVRVVPGLAGMGAARIPATVEQPEDGVLVLYATSRVAAGNYAVAVSAADEKQRAFELRVN